MSTFREKFKTKTTNIRDKVKNKIKNRKIRISKKIMIIGVLIVVVIAAIVITFVRKAAKAKQEAAINEQVETVELTKQDLDKRISVTGKITSMNKKEVSTTVADTKVDEVLVKVGDVVKAGDVLCRLNTKDIESQKEAKEKEIEIADEKADIAAEQANRNLTDGVTTAGVEDTRTQTSINQSAGDYNKAATDKDTLLAEYNQAVSDRKEWETYKQTVTDAANSAKSTADSKKTDVSNAQKAYDSKKAAIDTSALNLTTLEAAYNNAKTAYDTAVTGGVADTIAAAKAAMDSAKKNWDSEKVNNAALNADLITLNTKLTNAQYEYNDASAKSTEADAKASEVKGKYEDALSKETTKQTDYKAAETTVKTAASSLEKEQENRDDTLRKNNMSVANLDDSVESTGLDATSSTLTAQQELDKIDNQLSACVVTAPIDGTITSLGVSEGDVYKSGEIATIQDTTAYAVSAAVDQFDISDIALDMPVIIKSETTGDLEMNGNLDFISPIPKEDTTTTTKTTDPTSTASGSGDYAITSTITNPSDRLRLGMTVKASIITSSVKAVFAVPNNCITQNETGEDVITILRDDLDTADVALAAGEAATEVSQTDTEMTENSNTREIVVTKGLETDYYVEIISDELKEGMQVVVPVTDESDMTGGTYYGGIY